jgi:hypothetical protein
MMRAFGFVRRYNTNEALLQEGVAPAELSVPSRTFKDKHGHTRIALEGMRLDTRSDASIFDLTYAHSTQRGAEPPQGKSLVSETAFTRHVIYQGSDETSFTLYGPDQPAYISLSPVTLARRKGLLALAHEIGHLEQYPILDTILGSLVGAECDTTALGTLEEYGPAVEALGGYIKRYPTYVDDYQTAHESTPENWPAIAYMPPGHHRPLVEKNHPGSVKMVNAIMEASAWKWAFQMVDEDRIHPGYTTNTMLAVARSCIASYDLDENTNLYGQTFEHMLTVAR